MLQQWFESLWLVSLSMSATIAAMAGFAIEELERTDVPAVTYGVTLQGDEYANEMGEVTKGSGEEVTLQTGFAIGSVSKSFTALAVVQLAEAGSLDLDAPIGVYLDVMRDGTPQAAITIRQLLSHTSGYSTYQGNLTQGDFSLDADALNRRIEGIVDMELAHEPGTRFEYSNVNYMLAGRVIEVVSGQSYADYMEENVLAPAGMANSFVYAGADDPRLATGHEPWLGSKRAIAGNKTGLGSAPQGGIVSTGGDMARYLEMMMNGEDDVISAEGKAMMMRPANQASPEYGLGWFLNPERGIVFHSGANPGFEALATMVPAERKGVAVMVNSGSGTGFGDTAHLRFQLSAWAIDIDYDGSPAGWGAKFSYLLVMLTPVLFLLAMIWAWVKRAAIRAKDGFMGKFSLYFPVLMTGLLAAAIFIMIPSQFGVPLSAIYAFQPDMGLGLIAAGVLGPLWALLRLAIHFTGARD